MKSQAVKQLEAELYNAAVVKHPTVPAHALPRPRRSDTTANGLTQCIIEYIQLRGGQAERISIMGRPQQIGDSIVWTKSNMTIGTADISATIQGRSVKIEVKIGKDRQSEAQRRYQASVERAGGLYFVARDFQSFVNWYNSQWKNL